MIKMKIYIKKQYNIDNNLLLKIKSNLLPLKRSLRSSMTWFLFETESGIESRSAKCNASVPEGAEGSCADVLECNITNKM